MEIWKDIENYEGYYQVSSTGRVRNAITQHILIGDVNNIGYRRITLYIPIKKRFFIHRLVALHFCEGYAEGLVVNHKDGNKQNNDYTNLEWVTRSENDLHAYAMHLRKVYPATFRHKVCSYDLNTHETLKIYNNVQECCDDLRVQRPCVYNTCNGKQASCRGVGLKYA